MFGGIFYTLVKTLDIWGHFMCWFCQSLILEWSHLWSDISSISASSHCSFHFPRLHDLFHWSGPSLLGKTMVTILAWADCSYHNKHICMMHKHTLLLLLLLLKFPTSTGRLAYPPWPRGLTSQNWVVIKADTQVELYYQPLNTLYRNSHRSSKILYTGRSELKNQKDLLEQQIHCGFLWDWRASLKLDTKKDSFFLWMLSLCFMIFVVTLLRA